MIPFKDYLKQKAKFYSPDPGGSGDSSADVADLEVSMLSRDWKPVAGRRDPNMVDALLSALDHYLQNRPPPAPEAALNVYFQPIIDNNGSFWHWKQNTNETQARKMVDGGAINALMNIMALLGFPVENRENLRPPGTEFNSMLDYLIFGARGKICVELKSWSVMENALPILEQACIRLNLSSGTPSAEKVINKACLYMASHKANWLALTCHHKWVFFRLHNRLPNSPQEPYISYSAVEEQPNNTRPFRALLAMMLAAEVGLQVESRVDLSVPLPPIKENDDQLEQARGPQVDPGEDKSGTYKGRVKVTRDEPPVTRPRKDQQNQSNKSADIMISWTLRKAPATKWFSFSAVDKSSPYPSLGRGTVRLRLQRLLGNGGTGVVYEAKRDVNGNDQTPDSHSYALKMVQKGRFEEKEGLLERMYKEFDAYHIIEQARQNGKIGNVVPRCYGLFESQRMLILVLDYEGKALDQQDWTSMGQRDAVQIFKMISALHKIGIVHGDFEPRNIVRAADGSYKIIDFSLCSFHNCSGIKELPWYNAQIKGGEECYELKYLYTKLVDKRPLHAHRTANAY